MLCSGLVGIVEQRDHLVFFDVALGCSNDNGLYNDVLLIPIYIKLLYAADKIVTGCIDTAGIEPVVDIGVMRNCTNCVLHKKMWRSQHVSFLMVSIDFAGYFAVFKLSLRFCNAEEPVFTGCIHVRDGEKAFVLAFDAT